MTGGSSPPSELPRAAHAAWSAYVAMLDSKQSHYGYLESLEAKYQHGGSRTLSESARLANLLGDHDRRVAEFSAAIKALGAADRPARDVLIRLMTEIGGGLGGSAH